MAGSDITKVALAQALKELMETTPFQKISVVDICEKCGMNRKSFYYHFQDKYELVNWIFYHEFIIPRMDGDAAIGWQLMQDLASYFYDNKTFYKNALTVDGQNSFREYFAEIFTPVAAEYLQGIIPESRFADTIIKYFVDVSLIATVSWLNMKEDVPAETFFPLVKSTLVGFSKHIVDTQEEEKTDLSE